MATELWVTYVVTVLVLMSTPGPSQILMLSNSVSYGWQRATLTAIGDLTANGLQMLAAGLGLAVVLTGYSQAFVVIQWLGVAYLVWLGLKMISNTPASERQGGCGGQAPSLRALWLQGFITSAANPKAVVFFAALFPQFIVNEAALVPQLLILSVTYIVIDGCFLTTYGLGARWLVSRIAGDGRLWIQRFGGTSILFAAVLLGMKTI